MKQRGPKYRAPVAGARSRGLQRTLRHTNPPAVGVDKRGAGKILLIRCPKPTITAVRPSPLTAIWLDVACHEQPFGLSQPYLAQRMRNPTPCVSRTISRRLQITIVGHISSGRPRQYPLLGVSVASKVEHWTGYVNSRTAVHSVQIVSSASTPAKLWLMVEMDQKQLHAALTVKMWFCCGYKCWTAVVFACPLQTTISRSPR